MVLLTFVCLLQCACNTKNSVSTTGSSQPEKAFQNHARPALYISAIDYSADLCLVASA